jgi:hypothetical protein
LAVYLAELKKKGMSLQPILSALSADYDDLQIDERENVLSSSLEGCVISYCLSSTEAEVLSDRTSQFTTLRWLRDNVNMDVATLARAASLILSEEIYHFGPYDCFVDLLPTWSIS